MKTEELARKFFEGKNFNTVNDWTETTKDGVTCWYHQGTCIAKRNADGEITPSPLKSWEPERIDKRQNALIELMKGDGRTVYETSHDYYNR